MRIPTATYRLQLNHRMGFSDAKGIVPYLSDLGVSDVYSSPILKSRKGSMHGYDVVDPTKINPDLGGEKGFRDLAAAVSDAGMGWIQDIVPNHMAFDCDNGILMDVLEKGKNSRFFDYFDVLWDHPVQHMKNKLLVPVLGTPFEECLKNGEIRLGFGREGITIRYYEHRFPLSLRSYETVLLGKGRRTAGGEKEFSKEYDAFCRAVEKITKISSHDDPKAVHSEVEAGKNILWKLFHTQPQINEMVKTRIGIFNRKGKGKENAQGEAALLRRLLDEQWYRLAFWRDASEAINYRRFFDINGLISMNAERDEVFFHTHSLVLSLYEEGCISGLRIDHVDGLSDPLEYLRKLRANAPDAYIVVEKILDPDETLSSLWPVQGTTGYDYLNYLNGIFCRGDGERAYEPVA